MQVSAMQQSSAITELVIKSIPVDSALWWGGGQVPSPRWAGVKCDLMALSPSGHAVILIHCLE